MRKLILPCLGLVVLGVLALSRARGASSALPPGEPCSLNLSCNARRIRLGMRVTLELSLEGEGIHNLVAHTPDIKTGKEARAFKYQFRVQPKKEGICEYGPYEIQVNGRELQSPKVRIHVTEALDPSKDVEPSLSVDRSEIILGDSFQLILEAYGQAAPPGSWLRERKSFELVKGPSTTAGITAADGTKRQYKWSCWLIRPKAAGEFRITSDMFVGSTQGLLDEPIVVQVRDPAALKGAKQE